SFTTQAQNGPEQDKSKDTSGKKTVRVALVQFDAVPEKPKDNVDHLERLTEAAVKRGARWVMFHELAVSDCTNKLDQFAELVPDARLCYGPDDEGGETKGRFWSLGIVGQGRRQGRARTLLRRTDIRWPEGR